MAFPYQHLALHSTHNTPLIRLPCHHHLLLRFFPPPPIPPSFSSTSQPGEDPYVNFWRGSLERRVILRLVGRVCHCNHRLVRVYHHNYRVHYRHHRVECVITTTETLADLDLRRQRPAAVSPVQSPPQPPQRHQRQQQERYGQQPQLPGDGFYYQPRPDILQPGTGTEYGVGQDQYGNTGTLQYTPQLRDQNVHAEMLRAMASRHGAQGFDCSYHMGVSSNPGQPPPAEYGPR